MTLLVTLYTSSGIVFAADSAITRRSGGGPERLPKQEKFLRSKPVGMNGGIVGYFGLAVVNREPMDCWLRRKLDQWHGSTDVAGLAVYLKDALNQCVPARDRTGYPSGFHIGAFEQRDGRPMPVFQFVTNTSALDSQTGTYSEFGLYNSGEHFPNHPNGNGPCQGASPTDIRSRLRDIERKGGIPMWFRNGELAFSSRAWAGLNAAITDITTDLWHSGFRVPNDLKDWEALADTLVRTNGRLYALLSTRGSPTIEGPYRKASIPWPT